MIIDDELARKMVETLEFYSNPETYTAIAFLSDPPCGDFIEDFSDTGEELGVKPGKAARAVIEELQEAHPDYLYKWL